MDERRRPRQLRRRGRGVRQAGGHRRPRRPVVAPRRRPARPALGGRSGCATRGPPRAPCAPATSACWRWRPSRWSARRCCPTCARRPPPGGKGFYDYETWECLRVAEGSATVALRMAEELGHRVRYATPVASVRVARAGCSVTTATGERFDCSAVVSAIPVGPLRRIPIEGVSRERLGSLERQRHALAAKVVSPTRTPGGRSRARTARCTSRRA